MWRRRWDPSVPSSRRLDPARQTESEKNEELETAAAFLRQRLALTAVAKPKGAFFRSCHARGMRATLKTLFPHSHVEHNCITWAVACGYVVQSWY
ncbi:hypothetical protein MRX96_047425 [Rhipicephalus microplus]